MPSIRKRKKRWNAQIRVKGHPPESRTFDTKALAVNWGYEREKKLLNKKTGIIEGKTFSDAMKRYQKEESPKKRGERWEIIRLNKIMRSFLADILLEDLTTEDLQKWVDINLQHLKSSTVNREFSIIGDVLEVARKRWKWIDTNPARDVDKPKDPPPRDRRVSQYEIDRILLACGYVEGQPVVTQRQTIAIGFLFALETAMRQGEIWGMDWKHIDLVNRTVFLPVTKNGYDRSVPLSKRAVVLLKTLNPKEEGIVFDYNQKSCGAIFSRAVRMTGIKNLTFHDTRHEAVTRLARKLDVLDLTRMIGHRGTSSLMIYYNATASELAERLD